jgi:hypothetical protein
MIPNTKSRREVPGQRCGATRILPQHLRRPHLQPIVCRHVQATTQSQPSGHVETTSQSQPSGHVQASRHVQPTTQSPSQKLSAIAVNLNSECPRVIAQQNMQRFTSHTLTLTFFECDCVAMGKTTREGRKS